MTDYRMMTDEEIEAEVAKTARCPRCGEDTRFYDGEYVQYLRTQIGWLRAENDRAWPKMHRRIAGLENELNRLRAAYGAAIAYIEASPCDPDINGDQWQAWCRWLILDEALSGEEKVG